MSSVADRLHALSGELDELQQASGYDESLRAVAFRGVLGALSDKIEALADELDDDAEIGPVQDSPAPTAPVMGERHVHGCEHYQAGGSSFREQPYYAVKATDGSGIVLCESCAEQTIVGWGIVTPDKTILCGHPSGRDYALGALTLVLCEQCQHSLAVRLVYGENAPGGVFPASAFPPPGETQAVPRPVQDDADATERVS